MSEILNFLTNNNTQAVWVVAIFVGGFSFIKWIDSRNRSLKNERFSGYMQLIRLLSRDSSMTEQIAAAWALLEYKEYYDVIVKTLDNNDLEKMCNENWRKFVAPQVRLVVKEIKGRLSS